MIQYMTKSKFKLLMECPTKLYYADKQEYSNKKREDSFLKALAEGGYQVEALAQCYYPNGILIPSDKNEEAVSLTKEYLDNVQVTLFQAAIQHEGYFIRTDILIKNKNHLKLIEVKAKSINKEQHLKIEKKDGFINSEWKPYIADVAFQKLVIQKAYPAYSISSFLMLVDKDSICPTDGLNQKFLIKRDSNGRVKVEKSMSLSADDLSVHILREINTDLYIEKIWGECDENGVTFKDLFNQYCLHYFENKKIKPVLTKECAICQFKTDQFDLDSGLKSGFKECWQEILNYNDRDFDEPNVLELWNYRKKDQCLKLGLIKLKDFHEDDLSVKGDGKPGISASQRQWLQITKAKEKDFNFWIDIENLQSELSSWIYPLHFIDFETAMLPIPFKKGAHPYQGIAFQFSHHILDENGKVEHRGQFLNANPGVDPTIDFIRALKMELSSDAGTIFRYSDHENTYLNMILKHLDSLSLLETERNELSAFIKTITKSTNYSHDKWYGARCMVDLLELVKRYYYDPVMKGSNSIKKVLPAILQRSKFLQNKYGRAIYGVENEIPSKNYENYQWIIMKNGEVKDPYTLLPPLNKEATNEEIEFLFEDEHLKEGGAATIAYVKMQCMEMSEFEREDLRKALLKYCELDTLAMVMIVEAWIDMLQKQYGD
ncbi:DUF2779 domain-containing protein [Legionella pneumophila]